MWPHLFMRAFTAKSDRTLKLTVVLYPTFQLFLVPILLIGFAGVLAFPDVSPPDTIVPHLLTQIELSPVLVGLVCAGALAASMSSGDAILHAAASIGLRDGIKPLLSAPMSDTRQRQWIRGLVVATSATAYYFAVFSEVGIVALLLGGLRRGRADLPARLCGLLLAPRHRPRRAGGPAGGHRCEHPLPRRAPAAPVPLHEGVYGLVANVAVFVTVSLLTTPHAWDRLRAYTHSDRLSADEPAAS
jgi:Na+/proline symporter